MFFSKNEQELLSAVLRKADIPGRDTYSWYNIICTWFWVGQIKFMPGTFGSLAVYPIFLGVMQCHSIESAKIVLWAASAITFLLGIAAIAKFEEVTNIQDHCSIVIDEVVGMLVMLAISFEWLISLGSFFKGLTNLDIVNAPFVVALTLFRIFDIWKPLLIGMVDKYIKTPFGVILDDILAALCASFVIWCIYNSNYMAKI